MDRDARLERQSERNHTCTMTRSTASVKFLDGRRPRRGRKTDLAEQTQFLVSGFESYIYQEGAARGGKGRYAGRKLFAKEGKPWQ